MADGGNGQATHGVRGVGRVNRYEGMLSSLTNFRLWTYHEIVCRWFGVARLQGVAPGELVVEDGHSFIDYYAILQVNPECSARVLDVAYRHLAQMYHPDHPETADLQRFTSITEAYGLLRKPDKRSRYDALYARQTGYSFVPQEARRFESMAAISDATMHANILMYLYKKRRECARSPGAGTYDLLRSLNCSDESFEFHAWYLKRKNLIEITDDGQYAITVEGVDHVIATSQTAERTLRITQSDAGDPEHWSDRMVANDRVS
jgi:curved DNA-binding protein